MRRSWIAAAAVAALVAFAHQSASAYEILSPGSTVAGRTIAAWTAEWWTWVVQSPADANPIQDSTGALANQNNSGPVFFVAGTGGGPATRSYSVPAGKPLLIPMVNIAWIGWPPDTQESANAALDGWENTVTGLFASIDGVTVTNPKGYLEQSEFFSAGNALAGTVATELFGAPAGAELSPSKSVGYWLMVAGLARGPHTLEFGGSTVDAEGTTTFSTSVRASINLVPEPVSLLLVASAFLSLSAMRRRPEALT